jgi:hypothetical protein
MALVVISRRLAETMEEAIVKAKIVAAVINAAEDADLANLRDDATHLWPQSMLGLVTLRLMPDYRDVAGQRCSDWPVNSRIDHDSLYRMTSSHEAIIGLHRSNRSQPSFPVA